MVSFGMFPLAKALCHAAGVRLPKGTSTFIFWGREESGGRGGNGVKCEVRGGVKSGRRGGVRVCVCGRDGWKGRGWSVGWDSDGRDGVKGEDGVREGREDRVLHGSDPSH